MNRSYGIEMFGSHFYYRFVNYVGHVLQSSGNLFILRFNKLIM